MENASKALIMAGGILIGVIVITIGGYLFSEFGAKGKQIQQTVDARVLAEFNNNFLKYEKSTECTIHDIVSLTNWAKKINKEFEFTPLDKDNDYYMHVYLKLGVGSEKDLTTYSEEECIELLKGESIEYKDEDKDGNTDTADIQYYTCTQIGYNQTELNQKGTNRVNAIHFEKNKK